MAKVEVEGDFWKLQDGVVAKKKLTPEEKKRIADGHGITKREAEDLLKMGWEEGDAIPSNLFEKYNSIVNQPSGDEPVVAAAPGRIIPIEELSPEKQAQIRSIFKDAARNRSVSVQKSSYAGLSAEARESLENAVKVAEKPKEEPQPEPETTSKAPSFDVEAFKQKCVCVHCGANPFIEPKGVSTEDKTNFLLSIASGTPFSKRYTFFNDLMEVEFAECRPWENEELSKWSMYRAKQQLAPIFENVPLADRNLMFMQTVAVFRDTIRFVYCAKRLKPIGETAQWMFEVPKVQRTQLSSQWLDELYTRFQNDVVSEEVVAGAKYLFAKFDALVAELAKAALDTEGFWKASP